MKNRLASQLFYTSLLTLLICSVVHAKSDSGNERCLFLKEAIDAKNKADIEYWEEEIYKKTFFFRYLNILEMKAGRADGRPYIDILAQEPSSYFRIKFKVKKQLSLTKLLEEPTSKVGDCIAVKGRIKTLDKKKLLMEIFPVIVQHKDRMDPKRAKEYIGEVDTSQTYYMYTAVAGKKVVVSFKDKDLLDHLEAYMGYKYHEKAMPTTPAQKNAWVDFLLTEIAKRDAIRKKQLLETKIKAGILKGSTNAPVLSE